MEKCGLTARLSGLEPEGGSGSTWTTTRARLLRSASLACPWVGETAESLVQGRSTGRILRARRRNVAATDEPFGTRYGPYVELGDQTER